MENSKLNLEHTNRIINIDGVWYGIWKGTITRPDGEPEQVMVNIAKGCINPLQLSDQKLPANIE